MSFDSIVGKWEKRVDEAPVNCFKNPCWSKYFGIYELTEVQSSLFPPDGSFYKIADKADLMSEFRKLQSDEQPNEIVDTGTSTSLRKVVINVMAFVNTVEIQKFQIKNCSDFAKCFLNIIKAETKGYNEARIILDRYDQKSFNANILELITQQD